VTGLCLSENTDAASDLYFHSCPAVGSLIVQIGADASGLAKAFADLGGSAKQFQHSLNCGGLRGDQELRRDNQRATMSMNDDSMGGRTRSLIIEAAWQAGCRSRPCY